MEASVFRKSYSSTDHIADAEQESVVVNALWFLLPLVTGRQITG